MLFAVIVLLTTIDVSAFAAEVREQVTDEVMEEEVENVSEDLMFYSESEEILETLSEAEVTRAEWLFSLTEAFEMTVKEGGEVRPDDPVTREFASHTLN